MLYHIYIFFFFKKKQGNIYLLPYTHTPPHHKATRDHEGNQG